MGPVRLLSMRWAELCRGRGRSGGAVGGACRWAGSVTALAPPLSFWSGRRAPESARSLSRPGSGRAVWGGGAMAPAVDREGYWGPTTSTLDWCEENYTVTLFVAEFWNTVSNLIMIIPPIFGAIQSIRDRLEKRYIAAYLALTVVGMGSWCFHMTLKYEMQLLDELPMIYSCCIFVYCMFECFKTKNSINYHLIFTLVLFSLIVTTIYLKVKEPIFHQVMYGMLVFTLVLRSIYIVTWVYPWLRGLGYTSLTIFLLGFLLWNVDNIFCDSLRNFRKRAPPILGVTTQFHAWWHILTGLGSYLHILFSLYTRTLYLRYRPKVKFLFGMWPVVMFEPQRKH